MKHQHLKNRNDIRVCIWPCVSQRILSLRNWIEQPLPLSLSWLSKERISQTEIWVATTSRSFFDSNVVPTCWSNWPFAGIVSLTSILFCWFSACFFWFLLTWKSSCLIKKSLTQTHLLARLLTIRIIKYWEYIYPQKEECCTHSEMWS